MAEAVPRADRAALDDPFAQLTGPMAGTRKLSFEVVTAERASPHLRRLQLTAPELAGFRYSPGQDVMLLVAAQGSRPVRRRYTIRALDPAAALLTIEVVLHGPGADGSSHGSSGGPGESWAAAAAPGDRIEGIGPRGKITASPGADWHLFLGDESAMPAIFAMTEALPGDAEATIVLEVPEPDDEQELLAPARTRLTWLHRLHRPAGDPAALVAEAREVELAAGAGQAYVLGEAGAVLAVREVLGGRGLAPRQVTAKAYWGRGRANAGHGEPPRD